MSEPAVATTATNDHHQQHHLPPPVATSLLRLQAKDLDLASTLVLPTTQPTPTTQINDGTTTIKKNPFTTWITHTLRRKGEPLPEDSETPVATSRPIKRQRSLFFRAKQVNCVMIESQATVGKHSEEVAGLWMISVSEKGDQNGILALYVTGAF